MGDDCPETGPAPIGRKVKKQVKSRPISETADPPDSRGKTAYIRIVRRFGRTASLSTVAGLAFGMDSGHHAQPNVF